MTRTPESTIKQAILHPVEEIRTTALDYFSLSYTSDESLMPAVIQAVEQYGRDATFDLLRDAENLPQTEATVRWICDELAKDWHIEDVAIDNYCFALGLLLCKTRVDLLRPEMAELCSFPVELAERFQERIELASWDWSTVWAALECLGEEAQDQGKLSRKDLQRGERVVEALARHPEKSNMVLRLVNRCYRGDEREPIEWLEPLLAELAGRMRIEAAIPTLVERLHEEDEALNDACVAALTRIGGDRVVQAIAKHWPKGDDHFRYSAAEVLERIHTQFSVETCLEFIKSEGNEGKPWFPAVALLGNFVHEAVEPVRQMLKLDDVWLEFEDYKYRLVAISTIMGVRFPEYEQWYEDAREDYWGLGGPYDPSRVRESFDDDDDLHALDDEDFDDEDFDDDDEEDFEDETLHDGARMFPIGTVALYGPDDRTTTKIAAGVILHKGAEPIMKRWVSTNILANPRVQEEMDSFFKQYGVRSVGMSEGNMGCPHEEGEDFPQGEDCPFCPWWKGKQGSNAAE